MENPIRHAVIYKINHVYKFNGHLTCFNYLMNEQSFALRFVGRSQVNSG